MGYLSEISGLERRSVSLLRMWCSDVPSQKLVEDKLETTLGVERGHQAVDCLRQICDMFSRHGRRPIMRHHPDCACLGGDEACFANFVGASSEGQREDALLFAMLMVRPDFAPCLVALGEQFGLALKSMEQTTYPDNVVPLSRAVH